MELFLQRKFMESPKMYQYLKENSYWIKYLNRNPFLYKEFESKMKELYHERVSDKFSNVIDQIELVSGVLNALK